MIINGKFYKDADLNFNTVCKMEDMGAPITNISENIMSTVRAYVALCMRCPLEKAGEALEAHIINGGNIKDIVEAFNRKVEESGFFQALRKKSEEQEAAEEAEMNEAENPEA